METPRIFFERKPAFINTLNHPHFVEVQKDKLTIKYIGNGDHSHDVGCVQTDFPIPRRSASYYFEVEIVSAGRRGYIWELFA